MSQAPRIPYIYFGKLYEGPEKNDIIIEIHYEGKHVARSFPPETTIEDIVDEVSDKLGYENELVIRDDFQKFNVFIGRQKISMKRELGYYRNLLKARGYRILIERKISINEVKREIIRNYNHEDINVLMEFLKEMAPAIEQAEEGEKASYEDYQKFK